MPDPNLEKEAIGPSNIQDRVPPTERGEDIERDALTHSLLTDSSRPLTSEEKEAAEHDRPVGERVYAPASERVPKEPVPGHRDVVQSTDTDTPERHAAEELTEEDAPHGGAIAADAPGSYPDAGPSAGLGSSQLSGSYTASGSASSSGPGFARGSRPMSSSTADTPTPSPYASAETNPGYVMPDNWDTESPPWWKRAMWLIPPACIAVGVFLYLRWQRERNKPINRIRRQADRARKAAVDLRGRVPDTSDVAQPSVGLVAALASTALVLWRRMRSDKRQKQAKQARETISEADWQKRLLKLKERWTPGRLELEKISISKH
ncbi:MAG: hypothetical protein JOY61_22830 [Chloroflexi bacterium]|nr:hypothetical protein [Chloroflexota bacterium]